MQTGKEELKISRFADDMMLYINDTKNSTGKFLKLINTFSKVDRYKVNSQKSVALYTQMSNMLINGIKLKTPTII